MEEYLIYFGGAPAGACAWKRRALYAFFRLLRRAAGTDLLFGAGRGGEMPLGVPEWQDGCFVLQRTLANHAWSGIGTVQRVSLYVRSAAESGDAAPEEAAEEGWILLRHPEYFFRTFSPQLSGVPDCYWKPEGSGRSLAVPIDDGRPFLLPRYFCLPVLSGCGERLMPFLSLTRLDNRSCRKKGEEKGRYTVHSHRIPPF